MLARPPPRLICPVAAPAPCPPPLLARLQGRGTVVTGRVEQGIVRTGDEVEIVGIRPTNTKSIVTGEPASWPGAEGSAHGSTASARLCCACHAAYNPTQSNAITLQPPPPPLPETPRKFINRALHTSPLPAGVEMFKKSLNEGQAGDNVGLLIRGIKRDDVERGQVRRWPVAAQRGSGLQHLLCSRVVLGQNLPGCTAPPPSPHHPSPPLHPPNPQVVCKPGSIRPHKRFKGEIYALSKEEGGRHTPFFTNYKPQFFFRTADVTGGCWSGGVGSGVAGVVAWLGLVAACVRACCGWHRLDRADLLSLRLCPCHCPRSCACLPPLALNGFLCACCACRVCDAARGH